MRAVMELECADYKRKRPPEGGRGVEPEGCSLQRRPLSEDSRCYEDEQFVFVVGFAGGLEQTTQDGDIA